MPEFVLTAGIVCVMAALVGGGLKAAGIELPIVSSKGRQWVLGLFGLALIGIYSANGNSNNSSSSSAENSRPEIALSAAIPEPSVNEMIDEVQRLSKLNAKQKVQLNNLEEDLDKQRAKYSRLKQSYDQGEGTTEERERAEEVMRLAKQQIDSSEEVKNEAAQAMRLATARIDVLQKRIAERK